jgi:glycosyltransferase involved in cell wall biosynthesis
LVRARRADGRYRIDFALIILTGNLTRYRYVRPVVDADPTVEPRWFPIRTWEENDWLRFMPGGLRLRARHFLDSWRLFVHRPADALVIHALETYSLYGFWHRLLRLRTVIVTNPDVSFEPSGRLSCWILGRAIAETSLFVPFSNFTADRMRAYDLSISDRIVVIHPGLPLERWPLRPPPPPSDRFRILFVGGDLELKGIHALLDAFERELGDSCDLIVATQRAYLSAELEARMRSGGFVQLHLDLTPGSPGLQRLYREADAFVLPTRRDASSWVALEAMATGIPVVTTAVGGIPDIVRDGETGLIVAPDDPDGIVRAVRRLQESPELVDRLVRNGRQHVEANFDVQKNTARLLEMTKQLVDERRRGRARVVGPVPAR